MTKEAGPVLREPICGDLREGTERHYRDQWTPGRDLTFINSSGQSKRKAL